jgi:hypothetical protein
VGYAGRERRNDFVTIDQVGGRTDERSIGTSGDRPSPRQRSLRIERGCSRSAEIDPLGCSIE